MKSVHLHQPNCCINKAKSPWGYKSRLFILMLYSFLSHSCHLSFCVSFFPPHWLESVTGEGFIFVVLSCTFFLTLCIFCRGVLLTLRGR